MMTACPPCEPDSRDTSAEAKGPELLASLSVASAALAVRFTPVIPWPPTSWKLSATVHVPCFSKLKPGAW
jgi:hypothetical protein